LYCGTTNQSASKLVVFKSVLHFVFLPLHKIMSSYCKTDVL